MIKILTFGTFDNLHPGHHAMLSHAKELGNYLVVAVAPDNVVNALKGGMPTHTTSERIQNLKDSRLADEIISADEKIDSWKVIKRVKPNIIAIGHDQHALRASLENYLDQNYPDIEDESGNWQKHPKRPKIVILEKY